MDAGGYFLTFSNNWGKSIKRRKETEFMKNQFLI